jgi:hypothetical protein
MSRSEASGTEPRSKSYSISVWANEAAPINASLGQRTRVRNAETDSFDEYARSGIGPVI